MTGPRRVALYCSSQAYWNHAGTVWAALPEHVKAGAWAPMVTPWASEMPRRWEADWVVLVASYVDAAKVKPHPVIYVEHGAAQTYPGDPKSAGHPSYSGGDHLDDVALFLCPHETVAQRWRARYPDTPAVVVGCPWLDRWTSQGNVTRDGVQDVQPVVALALHWDCRLVPETMSAWEHYVGAFPALVTAARERGWHLLGHGHPRAWRAHSRTWRALGIEPVAELAEVLGRADVLVFDNSSVGPEAAAVGIPLVFLSAPWYRRSVWHGGRFWAWPRGQVQVDEPADLVAGIEAALLDPPDVQAARQRMVGSIYAYTDGRATERAVAAILALVGEPANGG